MRNHKFLIEADRQAARFRGIESGLLEAIGGAERYLDTLEKLRESTIHLKGAWQKRLDNVVEDPSADRTRRIIKGKIRELDTNLADAEKRFVGRWATIRNALRDYLAEKKRFTAQVNAQTEIMLHNETENAGAGGQSVWGQLGMILFAWKASNAFDDLSRIASRKR